MKVPKLRDMEITPKSGKHVCDTEMIDELAKDSLSGTNVLKQYEKSGEAAPGPHGGLPKTDN